MSTICAISTPAGVGGIAVARVSGPQAIETVDRLWRGKTLASCESHTAHLGHIIDPDRSGESLDQAVATIFRSPNSFTGEDVVEVSVHGSRFVQAELIRLLCRNGARMAEPGEFTRRVFAAGKLDLAQAEAVADVIAANSRAALRIANRQMRGAFSQRLAALRQQLTDLSALLELELDFSEEDVEFASRDHLRELARQILAEIERLRSSFAAGTAIKDGIPVAIAGPTNAGKSSLLNALLNDDRAIVSDIHGTTRDTVEDTLTIGDHLFRIIDTAGIRDTSDTVELAGIQRSRQAIARAAVIIAVIDATTEPRATYRTTPGSGKPHPAPSSDLITEIRSIAPDTPLIIARNKTDLLANNEKTTLRRLGDSSGDNPSNGKQGGGNHDGGNHGNTSTGLTILGISAKTGQGLDALRGILTRAADNLTGTATADAILITNQRHYDALTAATAPLSRLLAALAHTSPLSSPIDLMAMDLREALSHLASITGAITTPDILSTIFARFCIGK